MQKNILLAHKKARCGKREKKKVILVELILEQELLRLEKELKNCTYNQRIKLKETLTEICLNYQIEMIEQTKKQETQKNNTDVLNKFISSKEIEGCSIGSEHTEMYVAT